MAGSAGDGPVTVIARSLFTAPNRDSPDEVFARYRWELQGRTTSETVSPVRGKNLLLVTSVHACRQWIEMGIFDRAECEIYIQERPIQVMWLRSLDLKDRLHWRVSEPGEFFEGEKEFSIIYIDPEAMSRDIGNFNFRSGAPRHLESPSRDL